jgi:hypothetical protein
VRCLGWLGDLGVAFPARSYHAEQIPGHSAFPLPGGFCIVCFLIKDTIRGAQAIKSARATTSGRMLGAC